MTTTHGHNLYQIVPAVYRNRDNGDLLKYLQGCGLLLDQIHATLVQRLADNFPDNPIDDSPACQDWLLPYFAELLNVALVSPSVRGQRDEIANAIRWRQGKGTLRVIEEIAQAISQLEIVLQEGCKRVAMTPRLNVPLLAVRSYGYTEEPGVAFPSLAARHPGLPAVTVDFRHASGAVATDINNPAAQTNTVDDESYIWRQVSHHGVPCHPGHYDDVSRRSVDFRNSDWQYGHYHPRKILLYSVPPAGFFRPEQPSVFWNEIPNAEFMRYIDVIQEADTTTYRNRTFGTEAFVPVRVRRVIKLGQVADGVGDPNHHTWRFEGLVFESKIEADSGRVELDTCAARRVEVHSIDELIPVITVRRCLLKEVQAARGLVQLEYCTVLTKALCEVIQASDCIFRCLIRKDHPTLMIPPAQGCLRYCAIKRKQEQGGMRFTHIRRDLPVMFSAVYGQRGCGVLHPATAPSIRHGAEDGGEMGAYHDDHLCLLHEAIIEKLHEYLPVGLQAVVIPDPQLLQLPV